MTQTHRLRRIAAVIALIGIVIFAGAAACNSSGCACDKKEGFTVRVFSAAHVFADIKVKLEGPAFEPAKNLDVEDINLWGTVAKTGLPREGEYTNYNSFDPKKPGTITVTATINSYTPQDAVIQCEIFRGKRNERVAVNISVPPSKTATCSWKVRR
jgi:hypothetical protein